MNCNKNDSWVKGFISGLICGEASFIVAVVKQPSCKLGHHARVSFRLAMHIVDEELIKSVRDYFGFGNIDYPEPRTRQNVETQLCVYIVASINDCKKLIKFFRQNPIVGAKQKSFELWAECVEIISSGEHTSSAGFNKIAGLRSKMNRYDRQPIFRDYELLPKDLVIDGRRLGMWSEEDEKEIHRYLSKQITRTELQSILKRSLPSIDNKIKRMKKVA